MFQRPTKIYDVVLECKDGSRTQQQFQKDANIDNIIKRFQVSGVLDQPNLNRPVIFGDEYPTDFQSGMNQITENNANGITEDNFEEKLGLGTPKVSVEGSGSSDGSGEGSVSDGSESSSSESSES